MSTGAVSLLLLYALLLRGAVAAELEVQGHDSAAIATAIQWCQPGDTLRLPAGTFGLTDSVRPKSGLKILGAGLDRTILIYVGSQSAPFVQLTECEDVEIAHLTLNGRQRPLSQDGVRADNSRRLFLHDLAIRGLAKGKSAFVHSIIFSGHNPTMERGVTDSVIRDCRIDDVGVGAEFGGGIRLAWGSSRNRVEGNVIRHTGRGGIFGDHSAELDIRHNRVEGSGGEGLGIELWGGCPRSLIEDNVMDHWLSVDQGNQTAVRRNVIGTDDGTLKGYGIEIIARDIVVTDNIVKRGAAIGLSVSNTPRKNNVFWGYNTIRDCIQWGAQLQGESGGIAHQYFYRCEFAGTVRGDARARYPEASGHGFRFNGNTRELVFEGCTFRDNGGYGVQSGGANVDALTFVRCGLVCNRMGCVTGFATNQTVEFSECTTGRVGAGAPGSARPFTSPVPTADFRLPETIRGGAPARFECTSKAGTGEIVERLWDFNDGLFQPAERPAVLETAARSIVFLTRDAAHRAIRENGYLESAWKLANIYRHSLGAPVLGGEQNAILGMSEETTCYVSTDYFVDQDPYADYVVHEVAHIFHNCKRQTLGLRHSRSKEWLLDIAYAKRETFAYACEFYSRILEQGRDRSRRSALLARYAESPKCPDSRVDVDELNDVLKEAVAARNGWKRILARCSNPPRANARRRNKAKRAD